MEKKTAEVWPEMRRKTTAKILIIALYTLQIKAQ